ncbi:MAG: CHAT domain-containing protein, partial [Planctomycetaceae bacterium]|nr:CHAT domain-containing protein [Planctomycetaceae bacterium]
DGKRVWVSDTQGDWIRVRPVGSDRRGWIKKIQCNNLQATEEYKAGMRAATKPWLKYVELSRTSDTRTALIYLKENIAEMKMACGADSPNYAQMELVLGRFLLRNPALGEDPVPPLKTAYDVFVNAVGEDSLPAAETLIRLAIASPLRQMTVGIADERLGKAIQIARDSDSSDPSLVAEGALLQVVRQSLVDSRYADTESLRASLEFVRRKLGEDSVWTIQLELRNAVALAARAFADDATNDEVETLKTSVRTLRNKLRGHAEKTGRLLSDCLILAHLGNALADHGHIEFGGEIVNSIYELAKKWGSDDLKLDATLAAYFFEQVFVEEVRSTPYSNEIKSLAGLDEFWKEHARGKDAQLQQWQGRRAVATYAIVADAHHRIEDYKTAVECVGLMFRAAFSTQHSFSPSYFQKFSRIAADSALRTENTPQAAAALASERRDAIQWYYLLAECSDRELAAFTDDFARRFTEAVSISLAHELAYTDESGVATHVHGYDWFFQEKNVAGRAARHRNHLLRNNKTVSPATDVVSQVGSVRSELAAASLAGNTEQMKDLARQLTKLLHRQNAEIRLTRASDVASYDQFLSALPPKSTFVSFLKVPDPEFVKNNSLLKLDSAPQHYVAFVGTQDAPEKCRIVDLGDATAIEESISNLRDAIVQSILKTNETAETRVTDAAKRLSQLIIHPVQMHFGSGEELIISPDADLWHVPYSILPVMDSDQIINRYAVRILASGREFREQSEFPSAQPATASVIFAGPDFGLPKPVQSTESDSIRSKLIAFEKLPGTIEEANRMIPAIQELTGESPVVFTGRAATESELKAVKRPRCLVIATHGFHVAEDPADEQQSVLFPDFATRSIQVALPKPFNDPLNDKIRSGLVFAGANAVPDHGDDGILTALEVESVNLEGTELVILSACETGLGAAEAGQEQASLAQAFLSAGAGCVLASLWNVADDETAELTTTFLSNLNATNNTAKALREAQLSRIPVLEERYGFAPAWYWAAFTVTGVDQDPQYSAERNGASPDKND